jgi:aspartate/methionine/tyrosine aminotransferase
MRHEPRSLGVGREVSERNLTELRKQLRSIDSELIRILARRFRLVRRIGLVKGRLRVGVIDPAAEKSVMENFVTSAVEAGIDQAYARRVAGLVIEGSVHVQASSRRRAVSKDSLLKRFSEMMLRAEKKGRKLIRLDIGEPRFRTPRTVVAEAKRCLDQTSAMMYGSSAGVTDLTDAIASRLNDQYGARIDRSNVLIFPGARFAIFAAIRSAVSSLDRVLVCQPAWPAYESCAALAGARVLTISTDLGDRWEINLPAFEEQLKLRPKMVVINNPNNPTGKVWSAKGFQEALELAGKYRTVVLSDEVYASYCSTRVPSILDFRDIDAIYVNSFSKEFGMTGWRVAYAVADERRIARMRAIVETTLTSVPELVQRAAVAALKDPSREAAHARREICRRVGIACEELRKGDLEFYPPDGGFYIFPRIKKRKMDSEKFAKHLFEKHAVGVLPGNVFGEYQDFLRLAITESETAVKAGIRRIVKAIDEW